MLFLLQDIRKNMQHFITTQLSNFRCADLIIQDPIEILWFKYENYAEVVMTMEEIQQFSQWVVKGDRMHFGEFTYSKLIEEEDIPLAQDVLKGVQAAEKPSRLILRENPPKKHKNKIFETMEIELVDFRGNTLHDFHLGFDIIGRIQ